MALILCRVINSFLTLFLAWVVLSGEHFKFWLTKTGLMAKVPPRPNLAFFSIKLCENWNSARSVGQAGGIRERTSFF